MAKAIRRHDARALAFQVLYGLTFAPPQDETQLRRAFLESPGAPECQERSGGEEGHASPSGAFAWELVQGVWQHREELDRLIGRFSRNWRVNRMGRVELTLLRLAAFELRYRKEIPPKVVINEALELCGQFGEEETKSFLNGILDAMAKALGNCE